MVRIDYFKATAFKLHSPGSIRWLALGEHRIMKTSAVLTIAVATLATALTGCVTAQEGAAQVNAAQNAAVSQFEI